MKYLITFLIAVIAAVLVVLLLSPANTVTTKQSAYDRVMASGVLRCGYLPSATFLDIDPNSGAKSGIVFDYMTTLTKNLGLKLEWTEEIGRGDYIAALKAGRFDVYCTALTVNAERSREVDFTDPYMYDRFDMFVRPNDTRFDRNLASLNQKAVRFVAIEGDIFEKIVRKNFPEATLITLPQLTAESEQFLHVQTEKADVALSTPMISGDYFEKNPDRLRKVVLDRPFIYANTSLSVKRGEYELRRMIDLATLEMQANGQLDAIFDRHDPKRLLGRRIMPVIFSN